jgi:UPF0042 nucleotide-binding protein
MSGSGKGSVLRALEDQGYYSVDNLPVDLIPEVRRPGARFRVEPARGARGGRSRRRGLKKLPAIFRKIRSAVHVRLVFLEADDET